MKKKLLKHFSELEENELVLMYSMYVSTNKVMMCADSVPNPIKSSISNSCGQAMSNDGTEYQIKVVLVANQSEWRDKDVLEVLSPNGAKNTNTLNIDDIN
jgi:hypothetical protein